MNLSEYQKKAETFHEFKGINYPYFALAEETGELLGKIAKLNRGDFQYDLEFVKLIRKELGDVLWCVAAIASINGWDLGSIAQENIQKLTDRKERGVIKGEGDTR